MHYFRYGKNTHIRHNTKYLKQMDNLSPFLRFVCSFLPALFVNVRCFRSGGSILIEEFAMCWSSRATNAG